MKNEFDYLDMFLIALLLLPKYYQTIIVNKLLKDFRGVYDTKNI